MARTLCRGLVRVNGRLAGVVAETSTGYSFQYDPAYLADPVGGCPLLSTHVHSMRSVARSGIRTAAPSKRPARRSASALLAWSRR